MTREIQMAVNFIVGFLYTNLPRRRVDEFAQELCRTLRAKFRGHWYPDKPYKGSGYRSIRTDDSDAVLNTAARKCGLLIRDILQYMPRDITVWVDPGEVSFRLGERGNLEILYSDIGELYDACNSDSEVVTIVQPESCSDSYIDARGEHEQYRLIPPSFRPTSSFDPHPMNRLYGSVTSTASISSSPSTNYSSQISGPIFLPRRAAPLTFTTAAFAQTKFGSTKLKNSGRRSNRMTDTEFSNYIKQREAQRQMQQQHQPHQRAYQNTFGGSALSADGQSFRSQPNNYFYRQGQPPLPPQYAHVYDNTQYTPTVYNSYQAPENYHPQYVPPQQNRHSFPYLPAFPNPQIPSYPNTYPSYLSDQSALQEYNQLIEGMSSLGLGTEGTQRQPESRPWAK